MKKLAIIVLAALLLAGCLNIEPKPLNETGFLPPIRNYTEESRYSPGSFDLSGSQSSIECTINNSAFNETIIIRINNTNVRSDTIDQSTGEIYTTIIKGNEYYINAGKNNSLMGNCTWLLINRSSLIANYTLRQMPNISAELDMMPGIPKCKLKKFSPEIFEVNGTICDFAAIFNISK